MSGQTVASLATLVGGRVVGDGSRLIRGVSDLRRAGPEQIAFLRDGKYRDAARQTAAGALITAEPIDGQAAQIVVADVGVAYAKVALALHPVPQATVHRIHPTAIIDPDAKITAPVDIGPYVVVGRSSIGPGSVLMAGVTVADDCVLGRDVVLYPKVSVYGSTTLGDRVLVHANSVLGADGFGYARQGAQWLKLPHLGELLVSEDVEIGANVAIDRGALDATRIGPRTKIDNTCHIAHNCQIGADCAFAAGCMVAGSTVIGDRVMLAGHVVIAGHLKIVSDVRLGGATILLEDVLEPGDHMGYPVQEKMRHLRNRRAYRDLADLRTTVEQLRQRLFDGRVGD
ncbi:MAG: UDP-3-O-(3-hydroxymyristoyl)glucosamine N-acyltransferase [Planctomycetes bacterium]|nr:UDP-3-O-(3-hydroxymyristoyl)glucosamine N-acyltransferase [Planctomycetota bacterium]